MDYDNLCSFAHCVSPPFSDGGLCAFHASQLVVGAPLSLQHQGRAMWLLAVADGYDPGRDGHGCITWPFRSSSGGYGVVGCRVDGKPSMTPASRLLCRIVHGDPPDDGQEWFAAHECGRGSQRCVTPGHLTWKTREDNEADKERHGTVGLGGRNGNAVLTKAMVVEILTADETSFDLAKRFPASARTIRRIRAGTAWSHVMAELVANGVQVYRSTTGAQPGDRNSNRQKKMNRLVG